MPSLRLRERPDLKKIVERFNSYVVPEPNSGCHLWTGAGSSKNGEYGALTIGHRGVDRAHTSAHRFAWELANGPIPDGLWVLHRCDVPACVNPDHLFLGTQTDNMRDCARKGRIGYNGCSGERNPKAKLTLEQVEAIRHDKRMRYVVAKDYGVSTTTVSAIVHGKIWQFKGPREARTKAAA